MSNKGLQGGLAVVFRRSLAFYKFGATALDKVKLVTLPLFFPVVRRLCPTKELSIRVGLAHKDQKANITLSSSVDLAAFWESFVDREYDIALKDEPKTIFDLGSHVGVSVIRFVLLYPGAKIHAFEPDPENFKKLRANTEDLSNVSIYNLAIGDKNTDVELFTSNLSSMNSSLHKRGASTGSVKVEMVTLKKAIELAGVTEVDLLKFDVEGAEYDIFRTSESLERIGALVGELHFNLMGCSEEEFLKPFSSFGRREIKKRGDNKGIVYISS